MDSEKTNKEKHNFVLNEVVKRKILDMYNISKSEAPLENELENPENNEPQVQ